jgi:hypothetical protein
VKIGDDLFQKSLAKPKLGGLDFGLFQASFAAKLEFRWYQRVIRSTVL